MYFSHFWSKYHLFCYEAVNFVGDNQASNKIQVMSSQKR